jgi:S-adenosylmethionine decarboxylase proenzyme
MRSEIRAVAYRSPAEAVGGVHFFAEWYGCHGSILLLEDAEKLRRLCRAASQEAGLTIVSDRFHRVAPPLGVMGTVLLAESHFAIHTWPQSRVAMLDVFMRTHSRDERVKAHALYSALKGTLAPDNENFVQVKRGESVEASVQRTH